MDELVQFISASMSDMTGGGGADGHQVRPSSKPLSCKCTLAEERAPNNAGQICCPGNLEDSSKDTVQQSQVSSTRSPSVLANDVIGPLLLEALDGFLFMVDHMGKIQFISENVTQYLKYTKDDLIGNNIYNLVHCDDYDHFTKSLDLLSKDSSSKSRTFSCRMNIKPPGEERDRCYDNMQITAILQPHPCDVESDKSSRCLLACIAHRTGCVEKSSTLLGIEKFTTKQDLKGKILACDTSGGQKCGNHSYSKLIGENVQDFCHMNDRQQLLKHHREVVSNGSNTSCVYRFRLHENRYVFVQTKSKLFKNPLNGNPEFIMSTHSIIRECDTESELKGSASSCLMKAIIGSTGSRLSKDQTEPSALRPAPALTHPQSTIFDLDDFLNDPRLDFDEIADDSSFSDIPDLLPNSTKCTSLSNLLLDRSFASCPESPMSSMPSLSPAAGSASRSPRLSSSTTPAATTIQQGWAAKEYRVPKQGRGRPRSSKKSANEPVGSWMPPSAMGVGNAAMMYGSQMMPNVSPVKQNELKCCRMFNNPRSVGKAPVPLRTESWDSSYPSPSSLEPSSLQLPKKTGFGEISLIQQMYQLQKGNRQRSFSGSSGASSPLLDKLATNLRGGNKNAHLLDLLMRDDDDEEEAGSYPRNPPVSRENSSVRSATASVKSEHGDSEAAMSLQGKQPKDDGLEGVQAKRPAHQNAILKKLLSQADEDSQPPFQCDLRLAPVDADFTRDKGGKVSQVTLADSSAAQKVPPSVDNSATSASNEAEPKTTDDALLKQLLNKDESCLPSRASSPELLKSLLANDEAFSQLGEVNSSETEVEGSGLSSPTAMETTSLSEQLNEFLSSGVKRKALEMEEGNNCSRRRLKYSSRGSSVADDIGKHGNGGSIGPSKKNILLAQLLSKQVESKSLAGVKDLSAIATVTPLMQMLQQCGGVVPAGSVKVDDGSFARKEEGEDVKGKREPEDGSMCVGSESPSGVMLSSEVETVLQGSKLKSKNEETTGDDDRPLRPPTRLNDDSNWEEFAEFSCIDGNGTAAAERNVESAKHDDGNTSNRLEDLHFDLPKNDIESPSEEDRKILAELEEVLESSKFTLEDLNSIFILSNSLALDPANNITTKSAIDALEEQVSRIDSDLNPQVSIDEGLESGGTARCRTTTGYGWPSATLGREMNELSLLSEFDELMSGPSSQKYPSHMQGCQEQRIPALASSSVQRHDALRQQGFVQGQLQVNTDLAQCPVRPDLGSEVRNDGREAVFGDYTPISPALQDNVFSPSETFNFGSDLIPRSCSTTANYNVAGLNDLYAFGQGQGQGQASCSPNVSGRCHSGQMSQFEQSVQLYGATGSGGGGGVGVGGGGGSVTVEMRNTGERKRSGFVERFNSGLNPGMNSPVNESLADHGMYGNPNRRNFNPMNHCGWTHVSGGYPDGGMTGEPRSANQFNQSHANLMNGSRMNELPKAGSPFYGQAVVGHGHGRQMFSGRGVNQMALNQMNGSHVNQMSHVSMPQMNASQMNLRNQLNANQINVGQVNQLNFGSVNPLNMNQLGQANVGQMNVGQMNMGQTNMGQTNMVQTNMGHMNMGQVSRGNAFMSKGSSSSEFPNPNACHGVTDVNPVDRLQFRSNTRRNQGDFLLVNQQQSLECSPVRGRQRTSRKMNRLDMNFDCSGALGYGESGAGEQMTLQGNMNHLGLGSISGQMNHSPGGLRQCDDSLNQVNHLGQTNRTNHQMNLSGQMHHSFHGKSSSAVHGFSKSGYGPLHLGQSVIGQPGMGQLAVGQSYMGQPGIGQPGIGQPSMNKTAGQSSPVDQPIIDRISKMGMSSAGFESPPELNLDEMFQSKNANNSKHLAVGSVRGGGGGAGGVGGGGAGTPSLFGGSEDVKMYGYRMSDHHSLHQQTQQQQQLNTQYSNCADAMFLSPISNQSSVAMETGSVNKTPTPNGCTGFSGRVSSARDAGKTLQRNMLEARTPKDTSTREYIKQELRNMCTARAHGQSLQQQQQQEQQQQQQQQQQQLQGNHLLPAQSTSLQGFVSDELPLDILESINEITQAQEKQKLLEAQKNVSCHQLSFNNSASVTQQQSAKSGDPLFFTAENNDDPLGSDQFWESLSNGELAEAQQQALSFEDGLFDSSLDSTHVLPEIPMNQVRMMGKSGSILQKLLSDTT